MPLDRLEGPPAVQRLCGGPVGHREAIVQQADWKDPDDLETARARHYGSRTVHGWRRVWTISVLHASCPREITVDHVAAAERLLGDYETGIEGASTGRGMEYIDSACSGSVSEGRMDAIRDFREALASAGAEGGRILTWVVLENWSLRRLAGHLGLHPHRAHGRLYGALERLREHYSADSRRQSRKTA